MKTKYSIGIIFLLFMTWTCTDQFDRVRDIGSIKKMTVQVQAKINISGLPVPDLLNLKLDNYAENISMEIPLDSLGKATVEGIIPGLYNINISGKTYAPKKLTNENNGLVAGAEYYLNGNLVNYPVVNNEKPLNIPVRALVSGTLIFKEIYFCGSPTPLGYTYFQDQFYELYNNTEEVICLDGIYFAHLAPNATDVILPLWPPTDEDRYVYAITLWKFPGNGTDYPLKPGESCVLSQSAINHQLEMYNPNSPIDATTSEFEFYCNNPNNPDPPAINMEFVYNNGSHQNTLWNFLTSVFGGAYAIFRIPEGMDYQPWLGNEMQTEDLASAQNTLYAKVPVDYIIDAVEAGRNQNDIASKRIPGFLDAGMTYVGQLYIAKSVSRKLIGKRINDDPVFMDTNNSSVDFEIQNIPMFRRYATKIPSWNPALRH